MQRTHETGKVGRIRALEVEMLSKSLFRLRMSASCKKFVFYMNVARIFLDNALKEQLG